MSIIASQQSCAGHEGAGTLDILYVIPRAAQKPYHPHPGVFHGSARRRAHVPDTPQGVDLVKRLQFAFTHGLTFTVDTSMTTGQPHSVTWASIHHKTSTRGGVVVHGFPDANYFDNCNRELDALRVPAASDLP
jgi:Deltex C-terminal domain